MDQNPRVIFPRAPGLFCTWLSLLLLRILTLLTPQIFSSVRKNSMTKAQETLQVHLCVYSHQKSITIHFLNHNCHCSCTSISTSTNHKACFSSEKIVLSAHLDQSSLESAQLKIQGRYQLLSQHEPHILIHHKSRKEGLDYY